jgi:hypothetical protein
MPNRINLNHSKNNRDAHNFMSFDVIRFVCFSRKKKHIHMYSYINIQFINIVQNILVRQIVRKYM